MSELELPPRYRDRLAVEGAVLVATGAFGSAALLLLAEQSRRWPLNTVGQLALTAIATKRSGVKAVQQAIADAPDVAPADAGAGEPTPLWHIPAVVAGLALAFKGLERLPPHQLTRRAGWDASLRITGGSIVVGLAQMTTLQRAVTRAEEASAKHYVRAPGARLGKGTPLYALRP